MHHRWGELDDPDAYLRRSIMNLSRSAVRRRILERRHAWRLERRETAAVESPIDEMWAELGQLSQDQRSVIVLRYDEDFSIDEIAGLLGKPAGTVKSLLHRGIDALKEAIRDQP